jgi:hypothetical protein
VVDVFQPFKVGNSDTASVDVHVWDDQFSVFDQDIVSVWGDWTVGAFGDDLSSDLVGVVFVDDLFASARQENIDVSVKSFVFADSFGAWESDDGVVVKPVVVQVFWDDTFVVPQGTVVLDDSDDFSAGSVEVPSSVETNVSVTLNNNRLTLQTGGEANQVHEVFVLAENISSVVDTSTSGGSSAVDTSLRDWFTGDASRSVHVTVANGLGVLIGHPSHFSFAGRHIWGWDVDGWSEKAFFSEFSGKSSGDSFELGFRVFSSINLDTSFSSSEWNVDDSAFPGHQSGQSFNFVLADIHAVPHTTFGWHSVLGMLGSETLNDFVAAVVSSEWEVDLKDMVAWFHGLKDTSDLVLDFFESLSSSLFLFSRVHQGVLFAGVLYEFVLDHGGGLVEVDGNHLVEGWFAGWHVSQSSNALSGDFREHGLSLRFYVWYF